ncbi:hypothetical protein Y032_0281g1244 [Ancylostoma ceylanicum]|uniref:Uncharacterized protein n=1 Tax=Ancylostoma ceylanicum TaxID=53326 RepID=A0A016S7S7_9BILA|nr:hypothetical protein Y032_0281g1244 [Ancylostoma ceylanicum]
MAACKMECFVYLGFPSSPVCIDLYPRSASPVILGDISNGAEDICYVCFICPATLEISLGLAKNQLIVLCTYVTGTPWTNTVSFSSTRSS